MRSMKLLVVLATALAPLLFAEPVLAWELDGSRPVPSSSNQYGPSVESDTMGGLLIAWSERDLLGDYVIRMQRMGRDGQPMWGWEGISFSPEADTEFGNPRLLGTGDGGAFVVWPVYDATPTASMRLLAQRVDTSGAPQWGAEAVVRDAAGGVGEFQVVPDGAGGFIAVWIDGRSGTSEIFGQRVTSDGSALWLANGRPICTTSNDKQYLEVEPAGMGGVYVAWSEDRGFGTEWDVYAQRVLPMGTPAWTFNGVRVVASSVYDILGGLELAEDGGVVLCFSVWDVVGYSGIPYVQKLATNGSAEWGPEGVLLTTSSNIAGSMAMTSGLEGSVLVAWKDTPLGSTGGVINGQRVLADGSLDWGPIGASIVSTARNPNNASIVSDGQGGAVVYFSSAQLYAQRIDDRGRSLWTTDGVPISEASGEEAHRVAALSSEAAVFVAWTLDDGIYEVHAQRLELNSGSWGSPEPALIGATDIAHDQGGYVELTWAAGDRDAPGSMETDRYSMWRATTEILPKGAIVLDSAKDAMPDSEGPVFLAADGFYWEWLGDQPAVRRTGYSYAAETRNDSTAAGSNVHQFQVIAHGGSPELLWLSDVVSGYSIDNLAPPAPSSLAVGYGATNTLSWSPVEVADLHSYRVHRSTDAVFTPDGTNFVASTSATGWVDATLGFGVHYAVVAVDRAGNASPAAFAATVTDVPTLPGAGRVVLHPNAPNPFNPTTRVTFEIPAASRVTLVVVDTAGRRVRSLVDMRAMSPGVHSVVWDGRDDLGRSVASGAYRCHLVTNVGSASTSMVLVK